jgi:hypothetical protein
MITEEIGTVGLEIVVREDHAFGWQPIVISAPADLIGYQRRAEEIANRLRVRFDRSICAGSQTRDVSAVAAVGVSDPRNIIGFRNLHRPEPDRRAQERATSKIECRLGNDRAPVAYRRRSERHRSHFHLNQMEIARVCVDLRNRYAN